ncbi:MAG: SDR family oxidoreductase, partial [Comamonadaceae bacterium]
MATSSMRARRRRHGREAVAKGSMCRHEALLVLVMRGDHGRAPPPPRGAKGENRFRRCALSPTGPRSLQSRQFQQENSMRMSERFGIITAGASGMGRAGAIRFAAEGAAVAVVDIDQAKASDVADTITAAGGKAFALAGDLMDEAFARSLVNDVHKHFGRLDFLWAHAGHPSVSRVEGLDLKDFDIAMNLNVRAALASVIEAIPLMREGGGGSVLFTSSTSGVIGSPFSPLYS